MIALCSNHRYTPVSTAVLEMLRCRRFVRCAVCGTNHLCSGATPSPTAPQLLALVVRGGWPSDYDSDCCCCGCAGADMVSAQSQQFGVLYERIDRAASGGRLW